MIEPEELPEHAGKQKILIGEDISERLDVVAAKFRDIVTRGPKYAFKNEDGVFQAAAPAHIIEGGIPTEALLAQIAVSKYADGLPLYRQEAIYARDKVELDRRLMAQWMGKVGFELDILADYILSEIKKAERIFADETTLPALAPGSGSAAWLWAYARDDRTFGGSGPPMVAYRFEDSRATECVARHLSGYRRIRSMGKPPTTSSSGRMEAMTAPLWLAAGRTAGSSTSCMSQRARRSLQTPSSVWRSCGRSRSVCAAKALKLVSPRVRKSLRRSSETSSLSGRRHYRLSPASRSSRKLSAMPSRVATSSSAS